MKVSSLKYLIILATCGLTACSMELFPQRDTPSGRPVYGTTHVVRQTTVSSNTRPTPQNVLDSQTPQAVASTGETVGGSVGQGMDSLDRSKLSHALDNPIGKVTQWSNDNTGVKYNVVPVEKVTINGNSYCRRYKTTASKGGRVHESSGVACVGANGTWESV